MSKRLPYYQSEPAEYLAGDIMFCSYAAQGVFSIIRALYWQKDCNLTLSQVKRRCKGADELINELIDEDIIKINGQAINIDFLDEQFNKVTNRAKTNSENGKKGADARWKNSKHNSENIATLLKSDSKSIALREDKIKEDNIKEKEEEELDSTKFYDIEILKDFYLSNNKICDAFINNSKNNIKDKDHLKERLIDFVQSLKEVGRLSETFKEFSTYFRNWNKSVKPKDKKINSKEEYEKFIRKNVTF